MRMGRYVVLVIACTAVAIATVHEDVRRTQIGCEAREIERDMDRLAEQKRAADLALDQAQAQERLMARAKSMGIATDEELRALVVPAAVVKQQQAKGH